MIDNFNHTQTQPFFNTIFLSDAEWAEENAKATGMQKIIDRIFDLNPGMETTGWLMKRFLEAKIGKYVNLNSTRRCLSNLKKEGKLFKNGNTRIGEEGQPECFYSRNQPKTTDNVDYSTVNATAGDLAISLIKSAKDFKQTELF